MYFLGLSMEIKENQIHTKLYDKRNEFKFQINSFPDLSGNIPCKVSHGILISQLVRFSKACMNRSDFLDVSRKLVRKLISQNFIPDLLRRKISTFYDKYKGLIKKYKITRKQLIHKICPEGR